MKVETIEEFLTYFDSIRGRTRRVAACIPADKVEWTPRPGSFTLGDLVRHIAATERWMVGENIQGRPSAYQGCGTELADGLDNVLAYLDTMHSQFLEILMSLSDEDLKRPCITPAGTELARWKWLRAMIEHEVPHRGQIYLLLGLLDVPTPPLYGLTSEQVRERSVQPD
ncbi:MAG TPA: DinB family protein [Thermoanaerobaculia bacterium]|nr:DinB family protein [Thermoanaerobaculia bacterium]